MKGFYTNPRSTNRKRFKFPPRVGREGLLLFALLLFGPLLFGEGTKQLAPSPQDMVMLLIGNQDFGNFGEYNSPENSRLYFTVKDASETVYLGLSGKFSSSGSPLGTGSYQFRIRRSSDGAIVHGPFSLNTFTVNLHTWQEAVAGPAPITGSGGYDVSNAAFTFDPNAAGDYFIEFDNITYLGFFDISVVKNGEVEDGRVWSRNWALRTPPEANNLPECLWDREFNAMLYSYTTDGFVSRIDFLNSGFQGLSFNLAFNTTGPGTSGNVALDRMSIPNQNFTANSAEHQIFLNQPDPTIFLDGPCGEITVDDSFHCSDNDAYCLPVTVNTTGLVEVVLDFNHNGVFDPDSEDVLLVKQITSTDELSTCLGWDGLKGDGSPVVFGDVVDLLVTFAQGVQHWAVFDGEFMKNGFCVSVGRPICDPEASTDILYWDDRNIPDAPGTNQPKDGREGCNCSADGCRTWNYFDPNTENCSNVQDNNTLGYGDKNTLNTWWFARIFTEVMAGVPIFSTQIEGLSEICTNTDIELTLNFSGNTEVTSIQWYQGNILLSAGGPDNTSIIVNTAGTYRAVATDEYGCQTEDTHVVALTTCPIDLELDKSVSNATPYIGDQITFMLTIRNNGPGTATGVMVEDDLPSGFTNVQNITNGGILTGGKVRWTGVTIAPEETIMVSFMATVVYGDYINLAEIANAFEEDVDSTPNNGVDTDGDGNVEDDPDDEDDGDGVVVTPFPCDIAATVTNILCNHNGTPTEGFDDTFTFDVLVSGISTGSGWSASSGEAGAYNQTFTFGPFNISDGDISVVITDALSGTCQTSIQVAAPATCSDQCEINLEITNVNCNNGGTESDDSDDTFTFQLYASGYNLGNGWTATDAQNTTAGYNQLITFGPYNIADGDISFELRDNAEAGCIAEVFVPAPPSCSNVCQMTASISNKVCDDNGTPNNPTDDRYYFDAFVTGFNVSGSWTATGGMTGAYNQTVTFGPFPISQGAVSFILTDDEDEACHTVILVNAPPSCSPICAIAPIVSNVVCDDNGTLSDASDDVFYFDAIFNGFNYGSGWTANDPLNTSGNYVEVVTFGPYPISGGNVSFTIRDNDDSGCTTTVNVTAPATCSGTCLITADISNKTCDDNGTPSDASDDVYYFDAIVTGFNTSNGWTSSDGTSGGYNVPVTFGPYAIADGAVSFVLTDNDTEDCTTVILVNAPETCSPICAIAPIIRNIECNNGGTAGDASDDTFTFDVEVGGFNISGSGWTATDLDGTTGGYYQTVTFGPYPISAGTISFDIRDNDDAACTTPITVVPPPTCSDDCELTATLSNIRCDDNGTPSRDYDDVFYFDVELTGFNLSNGWSATDGTVGVYNNVTTFGPYPIDGGDITLTISDNDEEGCTAVVFAPAPPTCSDQCEINVEILEARCEDSGTPSHAFDDVFFVDVMVTGYNLGSQWTLEDGTTGAYNTVVTIGPYLISEGDRILAFTDAEDGECIFEILAEAPATCSNQCLIEAQVLDVSCDDMGTLEYPWDDVYFFELRVAGLNTSGTWVASDGSTGNYDEITLSVPHLISEGPVSVLIWDSGNGDCVYEVNASPPDVGIICPEGTDEGRTLRNIQLIEGDLDESDATFAVSDSLCWLPYAIESGERPYDLITMRSTDNIEGPALFTFILYTDMDVPVSPSGMPNDMIDGYGAIFFGNYDSGEPCCNLQTRASQPFSENQVISAGPIIVDTSGMFSGLLTPVLQMSIQMVPGQLYTLITTTWLPEQHGHYAWAVISHDGEQLLSPQLGLQPFPESEVEVTQALTFYDIAAITDNPESLGITGAPVPTTYCGLDSISFRDYLTDFRECQDITLTRVFTVSDILGHQDSCIQEILFRKPEINDIVFPPATILFDCGEEFLANAEGFPDPSQTGYPFILTLNGYEILQEGANYNIQIAYDDQDVYVGEALVEVVREWTIVDECNFDTIGHFTQALKFSQICDPIIECPLSNHYCPIIEQNIMLFQTDPDECTGTVTIALPEVTGISAALIDIETQIYSLPDTIAIDTFYAGEERTLYNVAPGDYLIRYVVTDNDGNIYSQDCIFRVADLEAPIAICADGLNISLTGAGLQRIYVQNVNMESYDNCGIDHILLRRIYYRDPMTCDTLLEPYYSDYGPYVEFNCCDVGLVIIVEMQVTDAAGNVNSCWLNVLVEDNTLPICYGLSDAAINCETLPEHFDPTNIIQLQTVFGTPEVFDNCAADFIEFEPAINLTNCSSGTIERKFLAVDQFGNESLDTFRQVISISENLEYQIRFPMDAASDGMHSPDTLMLSMTSCDDFTVTYEDEFLMLEMDECYNIMRTFSVINNCEYDGVSAPVIISRDEDCNGAEGEDHVWVLHRGNMVYIDKDSVESNMTPMAGTKGLNCDGMTNPDGYWRQSNSTGYWMYTQRILMYDTIPAEVIYEAQPAFCTDSECVGQVDFPFSIFENAIATGLQISVFLDLDANGSVDLDLTNTGALTGTYPDYMISGTFPIGNHQFLLEMTDGCGNVGTGALPFEVIDCYVPDPVCQSGLVVNLLAIAPDTDADGDGDFDSGAVSVLASDLAACSVLDCSEPLRFSVNRIGQIPSPDQESIILTCDDRYSITLEVYVWDNAYNPYAIQPDGTLGGPNYKSCQALVLVQDFDAVCMDCASGLRVDGSITNVNGVGLSEVSVGLEETSIPDMLTDIIGNYHFSNLTYHQSYTIKPTYNEGLTNGLSTQDIIRIFWHIQGSQPITSPYLLLAADVNHSGDINNEDMEQILAAITGDITAFDNNQSWIFVDADYQFPNPANPWSGGYPDYIVIDDLTQCMDDLDFVGIKVGDVAPSAVTGGSGNPGGPTQGPDDPDGETDQRSTLNETLLRTSDRHLLAGETYEVQLSAPDLAQLTGCQFTLRFDPHALLLEGVRQSELGTTNIGTRYQEEGAILMSWFRAGGELTTDENLFTFVFRARRNGKLSDLLSIDSRYLSAEAYDQSAEKLALQLEFGADVSTAMVRLHQNRPNPFRNETVIGFELPSDNTATLTITDVQGKVVKRIEGNYPRGYHEVVVKHSELHGSGVYYYVLETNAGTVTKKMVLIEKS